MDSHQARELRRRLNYDLCIGEELAFGPVTVTRKATRLVVAAYGQREIVRIRNYARAVDAALAFVERAAAGGAPPARQGHLRRGQVYHGVTRNLGRFMARCSYGRGRQVFLGQFDTAEAAARAYDAYVLAEGLVTKPLNFPPDSESARAG